MRQAANLYPGDAQTDRRDAFVIADTGRARRRRVHWLNTRSDDLHAQLRVLNGFDIDLAADLVRLATGSARSDQNLPSPQTPNHRTDVPKAA